MKHLYVGFSSPKGWFQPFSWLIRKYQGTPYSHVVTIFPSEFLEGFAKNDLVCEAAKGSVRVVADRFFFKKVKLHKLYVVEIDDAPFRHSFGVAASFMGANYSILENIGIVVARFLGLNKNPFGEGDVAHKCSETVFYILMGLDFPFGRIDDPDLLDVQDIEKILNDLACTHPQVRMIAGLEARDLDLA